MTEFPTIWCQLTPQLYEYVDAKLIRIRDYVRNTLHGELYQYEIGQLTREQYQDLVEPVKILERCRKDLRYEYLGLKDSWL